METLVVNLFGVPGSGKSTGAAYIFAMLKMNGINAELVTEYAKDKVWEDNAEVFRNQAYLFGKQSYRLSRLAGKVDVIVTDSPLPLSILYNEDERLNETFNQSVMDVFNSYNNINFLLNRTKPYNPAGRRQTEEESDALSKPIIDLLSRRNIAYAGTGGDLTGYQYIVDTVMQRLSPKKENLVMSPAQAIKYSTIMCQKCSCCNCPIYFYTEKNGISDCDKMEIEHSDKVAELVQKWAIEHGYLTENLEETGKND